MKKLVLITMMLMLGGGAAMAQLASNGYHNGNRGGNSGYNAPRGGNRGGAVHNNNRGPRGNSNAYRGNRGPRGNVGYNAYRGPRYNTPRGNVRGNVRGHYYHGQTRYYMPSGCSNTRTVYRACNTPGYRWMVTEGYFWVPGRYVVQSCGMRVWQEGYYEWRVLHRNQVTYASCGW